MHVTYPDRRSFNRTLKEARSNAFDFIVVVTAAFNQLNTDRLKVTLGECVRVLNNRGLLFVQGRPEYLPELGVYLDRYLNFKYWIAIESTIQPRDSGLPSAHAAILLFTKGDGRFNVRRTRFPHQYCAFCKRTLKDWGGKTHLMHPDGYVISDVWTDLPQANNYTQVSAPVLDTILRMLDFESPSLGSGLSRKEGKADLFQQTGIQVPASEVKGIIGPKEGIAADRVVAEPAVQYRLPSFLEPDVEYSNIANTLPSPSIRGGQGGRMFNVVHHGDAVEILKQYPDDSIDLVFADPPYNLDKAYHVYDDERADEEYVKWCNAWLQEYVRILKPTGSLYVLNLPRWTMYHAVFLNRRLYFQNWIVWDALSEPRGKLMPAHYGLLFYTKHPTDFTFNYDEVGELDARYYCLRPSCIRKRKAMGTDDKMPLTDIWWDIHRIKHKRDRDHHPCQLPDTLMERIIRLSTNEGDVVLDALCGTGTTPVTAVKLGRRYVAIDIDRKYVQMTREKIAEVKRKGYVERESVHKPQRKYTKKELQLELRDLAAKLGRLPTPEDVRKMSQYDLEVFFDLFPTWGKALKAAKLEVQS
ncbi:MAG: DNA methyltransferase [Anaerolineae bacterium]